MKKWLVFLVAIFAVFTLAACTANKDAGKEDKGNDQKQTDKAEGDKDQDKEKTLYMNNEDEPTSLDPAIGFDNVSWSSLNNLMEGLTRLGQNHEPEAAIAEKWDISEDGKTYTFHLRDNAKWSNGDPVTAGDFVYSWRHLLDPDTGSAAAFLGNFIKGAEAYNSGKGSAEDVGVEAVDDKTLKVTLEEPTGFFLNIVTNPAFFPVNEKVAKDNPKWHAEADSFVSNGPFKLTEWKHNDHMLMEKNDQYWDADIVKLDKVHWAMVNDSNTEYQMFESGELDMTGIPSELADQLIDGDNVKIEEQAGLAFYRFNVKKEPFQNEKIRKAFALAVNQEDIVKFVTKNKEEAAKGFVSPGFKNPSGKDFREANGDLVKFDADEAKKLLEEGMKEEGYDKLPKVTLTYNTNEDNKAIAETMQSMFKDNLGVNVTLENTEWNVFLEDQSNLKHQLSRSSFLFDYGDPINFLESFITDSSMNRTGWSNKEYDKLIKDAKKEADEDKRWDIMFQAEKLLADEMPLFPIHFYNQVNIYKDGVTGVVRHPVGYVELKWADKQ